MRDAQDGSDLAQGGGLPGAGDLLHGIAASHGVAVATAVVMAKSGVGFPRRRIEADAARGEWERFVGAVCAVQADLREMIEGVDDGGPEASILDAYLLMVGDELLAREVHREIHTNHRCADWAAAEAIARLAGKLALLDDPYIRERSHDIEFVGERLIRALGGVAEPGRLKITEPSIVVAHDLSPADTAQMLGAPVVGFVTEVGSRTSHTSIMARSLEIPAVVGVRDAVGSITSGDLLVVDGLRGRVILQPTPKQLEDASRRRSRYRAMTRKLEESRDKSASTADDVPIVLRANIELPEEASVARSHGADGVGLYRTEFLYVNRDAPPSEEEQYQLFRKVVDDMEGRNVTLRTFDIGGDKFVTAFRVPRELNPMLGLRAVRLALSEPEVFLAHLRAMVRASAHGPVRLMIPLIATVDELLTVRRLLERARDQVRDAGHDQADEIPLGVMIEVPAAAVMSDVFAREADFLSIGTNDLVQYSLAIDRTNRTLAYLASPYDPAILRLIHWVIRSAKRFDCSVSLCGEMASEPYGALLLLGLGMRELSMESVALAEIKEAIRRATLVELEQLAQRALQLPTAQQVERMLSEALEPRLRDLLTGGPPSSPSSYRAPPSSDAPGPTEPLCTDGGTEEFDLGPVPAALGANPSESDGP